MQNDQVSLTIEDALTSTSLRIFPKPNNLRSLMRIHPPTADEIGHGGNDAIGLLNDHEMPGARDIDDLHPCAQLIPECVAVARRGDYVIETLDR